MLSSWLDLTDVKTDCLKSVYLRVQFGAGLENVESSKQTVHNGSVVVYPSKHSYW